MLFPHPKPYGKQSMTMMIPPKLNTTVAGDMSFKQWVNLHPKSQLRPCYNLIRCVRDQGHWASAAKSQHMVQYITYMPLAAITRCPSPSIPDPHHHIVLNILHTSMYSPEQSTSPQTRGSIAWLTCSCLRLEMGPSAMSVTALHAYRRSTCSCWQAVAAAPKPESVTRTHLHHGGDLAVAQIRL